MPDTTTPSSFYASLLAYRHAASRTGMLSRIILPPTLGLLTCPISSGEINTETNNVHHATRHSTADNTQGTFTIATLINESLRGSDWLLLKYYQEKQDLAFIESTVSAWILLRIISRSSLNNIGGLNYFWCVERPITINISLLGSGLFLLVHVSALVEVRILNLGTVGVAVGVVVALLVVLLIILLSVLLVVLLVTLLGILLIGLLGLFILCLCILGILVLSISLCILGILVLSICLGILGILSILSILVLSVCLGILVLSLGILVLSLGILVFSLVLLVVLLVVLCGIGLRAVCLCIGIVLAATTTSTLKCLEIWIPSVSRCVGRLEIVSNL